MIEQICIRNWQSLRKLDLTLGRFTVIVGASSSGKSALVRAVKALASNVRGTSQITRGATTSAITVHTGKAIVTLEHLSGSWRYSTVHAGQEETYTKLAGAVPPEVTRLLGINPVPSGGVSLNIAGQFDGPFMLTDSGSVVARTLGELTNLDVILSAVREANRRRTGAAATLKTREADLAQAKTQLRRYAGLHTRTAACHAAEEALIRAHNLAERVNTLQKLLQAHEMASTVLAAKQQLPELPDLAQLEAHHGRYRRFTALLREAQTAGQALVRHIEAVRQATAGEAQAAESVRYALVAAGQCPTCGQPVS